MTEQNALVSGAERFLGVSMEAPQENLSPVYNRGTDEFSDPEKIKRRARSTVAARNLFATDISRLDDDAVKGLYQATAKAIFDIEDEDGTVAFGKKAGDPRTNVDLLRRFCKGEYSLIHDPEYEAYQKLDEEGKFRYALERETSRNKFKSYVRGERGAGLAENLAAGSQYSGVGLPPGAMATARRMTGNQKLEEDAQAVLAESARRSNYDALTPEEQAAYRADVIADYDTKLSKRQVLATYLAMREGLSDRASMLLAKAYNTGDVDIGEMESLKPEERDRAYTALSIMRGDQKKGRILGIETDFTDDTAWNRVQLGLYGFQSSVLSLVGDTYEVGKSAVKWTYAKTMLDGEERKKYFDRWDAETRAERALEQGLPDASGPIGEGFQSLMENIHWFIPYGLIGKGGKLMRASAGVAEDAAWYKKLAVTFTPWKFGANEKMLVEIQKAGKTVAEANRTKTLADLTLLDTITGPGRWTEGNVLLARQAATIEHYTKALQEAEKAVTAAKVSGSAGLGMYAAGEASAFSAFANEYITTCDAAGISREDSVPMAAAIGWLNAKIEHIYVPGLESGLAKSEVKSLMFTSLLNAMRTDGMAGTRKWLVNRVSYGIREGVKVAASEGAVEEPLQQIVIEHGKALAATSQKLRENGQGTLADELDAYWKTIRSTAATDLKTYLDTAVDMIPSSVGFGLTTIGNQTRRQHLANARIRHANRVKYQKAVAEAEKNGQPIPAMPTMLEEGEGGMMRFNADAVDYDVGVADIVARAVGVQNAVRQHWDGTDASAESGKYAVDPNGMLKAITAARTAWNEDSGDVVAKISDAAAVDHKTAELLADYFTAEAQAALGSPNVRSFVAHDLSAVDFSEETLKKVLPGYVDGSFVHDESQGLYAGKVTMPNGETKTIAYVYGDISEKLMKIADEQSKIGSELGKSHDARVRSGTENGKLWDEMSDADRYTYALKCTNALSTGSGSFVVTDKDGKEIIVNADDVIYLSNGQFGNVGYSSVANMGTVRHETWHSIWRFLSSEFSDAEKQDLAKKLGVDVTKDGWEVDLDETMAYQFGQYASGNYVNHNVDGVVARFVDSAAGKMIRQLAKIGIGEEMKNPATGKAFTLADFFDSVQRGEIGTGRLGYVQTEAPVAAIPTAEPRRQTDEILVEVKPEETADVETAAAKEAEKREPEAAPEPTVDYTLENPADASVPNARFYRVTAGDGVTLVGELVVSDASQLKTSYKGNLSDPKLQNRGETDEGNALVKKIAGKPDPLQVGTVQPRANNGFVWTTPSRDVFIGNTRSTGITEAYAQGNGEAVETHMRSEAAKRGIEIPDDVKNPVVHFVLRKIESDDAKTDIYDVVRMTNESVNRGMNKYEQAKNDADVLINNNIVPGIVINTEGNIDTSKSADAIGVFRQLTGAQGLIDKNTDLLSEEGETRLKNAILASLLKNTNEDLLAKIISQSKHLDMENEKDAIIRLASEILRLSATKPQYDLRAPLSEALEYYVEWRDKDERLRAEAGKDRRMWTERTSDGKRKRGLTWETHMGQGDMFRTPSPEARILGDLFAASRELRSFDKEDNESSAGKNRAQKLIGDYLSDYIRNADAVNTETNDLFGTPPATKLELMTQYRKSDNKYRFCTVKGKKKFSVSDETRKRFADDDSTSTWEIHVEPALIKLMTPTQLIESAPITEESDNTSIVRAMRKLFNAIGIIQNISDGKYAQFNNSDAGKMLIQSGVDMRTFAPQMKQLFEKSILSWSEPPMDMPGHAKHPDVIGYKQYINKFTDLDGVDKYVRFTIREHNGISGRRGIHAATISEVAIYENENAITTSPANKSGGSKRIFTDDKISKFLSKSQGYIRASTVQPRTIATAYPRLDRLPDEQLIAAAIASKMAFGKHGKLKNRIVNVNEVQRYIKALHPNLERLEMSRKTQEVTRAVKEIGNRMKDDIARGVSESQILQHLPERMRDVFEGEMTGHAIKGANVGSYHERAVRAIEERQTKVIENAVAVQSGVETALLENVYGIDFSQTLMALAENPYLKKDGNGNFLPTPGTGSGFDGSDQTPRTVREEREVSQAIKTAVDEIVAKSKDQLEDEGEDKRTGPTNTRDGETTEEGEGGLEALSEGDIAAIATKRAGVDLQNPRQLALFITELARRWWVKKNNLALNADAFRDRVALQFLRKTAANIYTKLVREITYSQSRDSATQAISGFENAPTLQGLQREMTYVGQLINAKKIRETQQEMCERLDQLLRERFGATGRFKADREELRRKVSAEMELRARYTRHAMWLTPNAAGEEAQRLRDELDQVAANFEKEDHDADHSRVAEENIRKLNILREFGALRYKPLADIESALRYWDNALEGETDAIVRANYERDVRTKKAAEVLARAFHNPRQKYAREDGLLSLLGDYIQGHMAFTHLLRDMMRFASEEDAAQAERIIQYLELEIQKAGTRSTTEQRKHAGALAVAVQQLYGRDFTKVLSEFAKEDERFAPFMGEKDGKRIKPTKGRAIQLMVSLLQVGHQIEVEDPNDPKKTVMQWVGGYHDNIVKHHRETQAAQIAALLSPADLNLVKWIGQWYDANRQELSNECQALFGMGVYAETWNYFPVKMLLDKQGLEKGDAVGWTIFPKALTPRVRNERDFDTSADILQMFMSRMEESAQWKAHAKLGLELRGIFGRTELQNAVCANHGNKANSLMLGFITDTLSGHGTYDRSPGGVEYYSDMIRGWAALGALGGNVGVMFKQTTSIPAFGFEIGMVNVAKHMASAFTPDGIAAMRKIFDSDERKNRWSTGNTEAVKNALATNKASALKKMLQASMITNKIGDCVPGLVIGQGIYRDALERGMTDENAMAYTWMMIERTQQSSRIENQTSFQRRSKLGRAIYQFLSTQQQYLQYEARAIRKVMANPSLLSKEGRKRWMELGRAAFLNHFVLTSAYFWMGQLYKRWLGQKPPEDELKDWTISCLLGPYGALYMLGFTCTEALNKWIKGQWFTNGSSVPSLSWANNIIVRDPAKLIWTIFDDNKTFDDVREETAKFASDANALFRDLWKIYRWRIKNEPQ